VLRVLAAGGKGQGHGCERAAVSQVDELLESQVADALKGLRSRYQEALPRSVAERQDHGSHEIASYQSESYG